MSCKERGREMSQLRRMLLVLLAAMILGFGVSILIISSFRGVEYEDTLLRMREDGAVRSYSGRVDGEKAVFTVSSEGIVEYQWGDYAYGPYQVLEDPAASPKGGFSGLPGIEIRRENEVLFRGGYIRDSVSYLIQENGEQLFFVEAQTHTNTGGAIDENGQVISGEALHEPGLSFLAELALEPKVTHRGSLGMYLVVTLLAAFNMVQICFPGAMFRLRLWGRVRNVDAAGPSDFYTAMKQLEWVVLTAVIFALYCQSLWIIC